jgi:hypothetical protein
LLDFADDISKMVAQGRRISQRTEPGAQRLPTAGPPL